MPWYVSQVEDDVSDTLFKQVNYTLGGLAQFIELGQVGLPDIQRPFVWKNAKVRDLFDSMYRGYPVGYFLFWQNGYSGGSKAIGTDAKQKVPDLLIVDGQQRLTSLYAVVKAFLCCGRTTRPSTSRSPSTLSREALK